MTESVIQGGIGMADKSRIGFSGRRKSLTNIFGQQATSPMGNRLRTLLILLVVAVPVLGCGQRSLPSATPNASSPPTAAAANYSLVVRSDSGTTQKSVSGDVDVTMGDVHVRIHDGDLTVNGQKHGPVRNGDAVLVQADGQVIVNLQVRRPL
jgi:hypothetical protein